MDRISRPRTGADWIPWVNRELARLTTAIRGKVPVPIGGMILWPVGVALPDGPWLRANGATFTAATWPLLNERLGSTTLPNPAAVSTHTWIIRAG